MLNDSFKYSPTDPPQPVVPVQKPAAKTQLKTVGIAPWGPVVAIAYVLVVYIVSQLVGSLLVIVYPHLRGWDKATSQYWLDHSIVAQFWFVLLAEGIAFAAIWWFVRYRKARLRVIGWRWPRWKDPLYTLVAYVVYVIGYAVLLAVVTHLFPSLNVNQKQDLGFTNPAGVLNLSLTFISLVVLPPIVEETMFRGFVYTGLRGTLRPIWAALITSALFAALHLEFGDSQPLLWVAAIDTFTLSLVLCYLRQKTDSLWPGILLHALKNGVAFATLFLIGTH